MQPKLWLVSLAGFFALSSFTAYKCYDAAECRNYISMLRYENGMLMSEINILESNPKYNDGYRDAIIKIGGPQSPGSYQDGWDAAIRVLGDNSYVQGYHNAIKQFNYTKDGNLRWLIEESIPTQTKPITPIKK